MNAISFLTCWRYFLLRGAAILLAGVAVLVVPSVTTGSVAGTLTPFVLLDACASLVAAVKLRPGGAAWWFLLADGTAGVLAAAVVVAPGLSVDDRVFALMVVRTLMVGLVQVAVGVLLRAAVAGEWLLSLSGGTQITFGLLLWTAPEGLLLTALVVADCLLGGVCLAAVGLRFRVLARDDLGLTSSADRPRSLAV